MILAAVILGVVLVVFTLGKSPVFRVDRAGIAIIGSVLMIATGIISFEQAIAGVDYKTIVILFSMMVVVANLKLSGFFEFVGLIILKKIMSKKKLLLAIILVSGAMSALAINDIVCLLFTPIVVLICKKINCTPIPYLLGVAMASNIGSAATLLGNPQNILVGSLSKMSFLSYFITVNPVAIIGLFMAYAVILFYYREELKGQFKVTGHNEMNVHKYLIGKACLVIVLVLAAYMSGYDLALTASFGAAFLLMTRRVKPNKVYAGIDFNLLVIFIGLFVIVAGVEHSGLMSYILQRTSFSGLMNLELFAVVTLILSNIVSNVPAVLLMKFLIPVENADLWWKALALFSTLAGNLTITGSIANLIVVEIAKQNNIHITAKDYFKVGFPLTVITTALGCCWLEFVGR